MKFHSSTVFRKMNLLQIILSLCLGLALVAGARNKTKRFKDKFLYLGSFTPPAKGRSLAGATTSHYYISISPADWVSAEFMCDAGFDSELVAIESAAENSAIKSYLSLNRALNVDFWTSGYFDTASGSYLWDSTGALVDVDSFGSYQTYNRIDGNSLSLRTSRTGTVFNTQSDVQFNRFICESRP